MSRLYYDVSDTYQPSWIKRLFRIGDGKDRSDQDQSILPLDTDSSNQDNGKGGAFLEKVAKLIPSEVIAGYLSMIGFVEAVDKNELKGTLVWIVFSLALVLTPLYLNKVAQPGKPKRNHLILSTIAFMVWAHATTGKQLLDTISLGLFDQAIASILLIAFSLISAVIPLNK